MTSSSSCEANETREGVRTLAETEHCYIKLAAGSSGPRYYIMCARRLIRRGLCELIACTTLRQKVRGARYVPAE